MTVITIPLNGFNKVEIDSFGQSGALLSIYSETAGSYAEAMLDEDAARQIAAALLAPWDKK